MTYEDAMTIARKLARQSPFEPGHIKAWNAFEDELLGKLSLAEADAMRTRAENETRECMAAGVILAILN